MDRKRVFVVSEDAELAQKVARLLDRHGVTGFWVSEGEGEKLERLWKMDARITQQQADGSLGTEGAPMRASATPICGGAQTVRLRSSDDNSYYR